MLGTDQQQTHIVAGVYYKLPDQEEQVDEAFYRQLEVASHSKASDLMQDFNHLNICWRNKTAEHEQFRRLLECINDHFLIEEIADSMRKGALQDLKVLNKKFFI